MAPSSDSLIDIDQLNLEPFPNSLFLDEGCYLDSDDACVSLERDRPLDFHWVVDIQAAARTGWRPTGKQSFDRAVRSIMAALVLAYRANDGWVSYSRRREWYTGAARYKGLPYTYSNVTRGVDALVSLGLAEEKRARPGDNYRTGLQSRVRATSRLVDSFDGVRFAHDPIEVLRLRDQDKRLIDYADTDKIRRRRREVEAINKGLSSVRLTLPVDCIRRGDEHVEVGSAIVRITPFPFLYRVFSRGRWDKNGRLYWWGQNLPFATRARMLIDGEAVVEIDYESMHPSMLYARRGAVLGFDPYAVPGFTRKHGKNALLVGINAPTRQSAIGALMDRVERDGSRWPHSRELTGQLFDAVVQRNHFIADDIGSDAGIDLMHADSEIAIRIVKTCLKAGITCLPIHDSFIVPARFGAALSAIMDEEMERYIDRVRPSATNQLTNCEQKKKLVSCSTYGGRGEVGERLVVESSKVADVSCINLVRSVPAQVDAFHSVKAFSKPRKGQMNSMPKKSVKYVKAPSFDFVEQQRREAAWLADPSQEYIPTPGESESLLFKLYGPDILVKIKEDRIKERRQLFTGNASCVSPTLAERRAGRRLSIAQGGTLLNGSY